MNLYDVSNVQGLPEAEVKLLSDLITVWSVKHSNNAKRIEYYLGHNSLKNLGISIPPELQNKLHENIGWTAKAVDSLAVRSRFDGFSFNGEVDERLEPILAENNFKQLYVQAVTSELINSCAFMTVSKGRDDEPEVLVNAYSALTASAMWDTRRKCIRCGLTVVDTDKNPRTEQEEPIWVNLYTNTHVWEIRREEPGQPWVARGYEHQMGRPLIEPLVYKPELLRPFGRSRITRSVMSIVDNAVRTQARAEMCAEFYSRPQRYLLGADEEAFSDKTKWEAYIGSIFAVSKDEDGDVPQYGQLASASMQPHLDQLRSLAAQFAGETNIPLSELGVVHDNPASADAIYAAKEGLVIEAENLNATNGEALKNVGKMILATLQDKTLKELTDVELSIQPIFKHPDRPSAAQNADMAIKWVGAIPWLQNTDVILEYMGFSEEERMRMKANKAKYEAQQAIYQSMQEGKVNNGISGSDRQPEPEHSHTFGEDTEAS